MTNEERLRNTMIYGTSHPEIYKTAQDEEIERLRAEIEKLHRETAIRIDQIEREQEAHLKTMADFNKQAEMNARLLTENASLRAENEKLRKAQEQLGMFFIKIGDKGYYVCEAIWREFELLRETKAPYRDGFSDGVQHERQRISYENEKLREALKPFAYYASQIPDDVSDTASASGTVGDLRAAAAAIRESGDE